MSVNKKSGLSLLVRRVLVVLLFLLVAFVALNFKSFTHIYHALNIFKPDKLVSNFRTMDRQFPANLVAAGEQTTDFVYNKQQLPEYYSYDGQQRSIAEFFDNTDTTGLIITRGNEILFEDYFLGNTEESRTIVWSVSKSVVSALVGIAIEEGYIDSIGDPVSKYVPSLATSGYGDVAIKDVLQMSSGIDFTEDYFDGDSDFNRMAPASVGLGTMEEVLVTLEQKRLPGQVHNYVSSDAQVLGMVVTEATEMDLAMYTQTRLWLPAGMEFDAYWLIDSSGMETAFGGLNATLRDLARFGNIYLNQGVWNGEQIVPRDWVKASTTADSLHLQPSSDGSYGYGYQWWLPAGDDGSFMAIGIYGQNIYVNPAHNIVIARTAAYREYEEYGDQMDLETAAVMQAIAAQIN